MKILARADDVGNWDRQQACLVVCQVVLGVLVRVGQRAPARVQARSAALPKLV